MSHIQLKNWANRKAAGKVSITVGANGAITLFKKDFDEDGGLLPDLQVFATTSATELRAEIADLNQQRNIIIAFLTAEGL